MIVLPAGSFLMGADNFYSEEGPVREVQVGSFAMDVTPVTHREFSRFVDATGHVTLAERTPAAESYPDAFPDMLVAGSAVFSQTSGPVDLSDPFQWWHYEPRACWKRPYGRQRSIRRISNHPVTQISYDDAMAYAEWAGKDLPTEAEWEYAARGGLSGCDYAWGDEMYPGGRRMANTWSGHFPWHHDMPEGFDRTTPVGLFPANGFGFIDIIGNVWEWTRDCARGEVGEAPSCCSAPAVAGSCNKIKILKGGSHLCAPNYCKRYRPAARHPQSVDSPTSHIGFRCVRR